MKFKTLRKSNLLFLLLCGISSAVFAQPKYEYAVKSSGSNEIPLGSSNSKTDYSDHRCQMLYQPNGYTPNTHPNTGTITNIYFKIASKSVATTYTNFVVNIGNANITSMTTAWVTGLTQALNEKSLTLPAVNAGDWLKIELKTPVTVDLTKPLVIDIAQDAMNGPVVGYDIMQSSALVKGGTQTYSTPANAKSGTTTTNVYWFGFDLLTCSTSVLQDPVDATVCESQQQTFSMKGDDVSSYQWQVDAGAGFNDIPANDSKYSGATTDVLTTVNTPHAYNNYKYRCVVTKNVCKATSKEAVLRVDGLVSLDKLPARDTTCIHSNKDLSVSSKGTVHSYQWQVYVNNVGYIDVPTAPPYLAMGNTLRIMGVPDTLDGAKFRCIVNGACNNETTNDMTLSVEPIPYVAASPRDTVVAAGKQMYFEVQATSANARYQWQVAVPGSPFVNVNDGGIYQGVKTNRLYVNGTSRAHDGFMFRCIILGNFLCNSPGDTSEFAVLTVPPGVSVQNVNSATVAVLYPNPANGSDLFISIDHTNERALIYRIADKTGRMVAEGNITENKTHVDISRLPADMYIVQVAEGNTVISQTKFVKL